MNKEDILKMIQISHKVFLGISEPDEQFLIEIVRTNHRVLEYLEDESFRTYIKLIAGV